MFLVLLTFMTNMTVLFFFTFACQSLEPAAFSQYLVWWLSPCRQVSQAQLFCNSLQTFDRVGCSLTGPALVPFAPLSLLARLGVLGLGLVSLSFGCTGKRAVHLQGRTTSQSQVLQAADKTLLFLHVLAKTGTTA